MLSNDMGAGFQATNAPTPQANSGSNAFGNAPVIGTQLGTVDVQNPVNQQQVQQAYGQSQQGLSQQQAFMNALSAQNGIGNQSSVFNQQQGLANQLQVASNGGGPNPAQAMLQQQTSANTANQAAMMAGQRGAGANAGLIARQAAMQGASNQQNAIGQAATMDANQQIAARGQLMQQQQGMGSMAGQQVSQQAGALSGYNQSAQGLFGAGAQSLNAAQSNAISQQNNLNNANVSMQSNMNNANVGMQSNLNNNYLGMQSNINNNLTQNQANVNNANSAIAQGNQAAQAKQLSGITGGIAAMMAKGGEVKRMADGGGITVNTTIPGDPTQGANPDQSQPNAVVGTPSNPYAQATANSQGPNMDQINKGMENVQNLVGSGDAAAPEAAAPVASEAAAPAASWAGGVGAVGGADAVGAVAAPAALEAGAATAGGIAELAPLALLASKGGQISEHHGLAYLKGYRNSPKKPMMDHEAYSRSAGVGSQLMAGGGVPGQAKVKGDSLKNDTVKALLSPGEVVIPRSIMESKDPASAAAKFVASILKKKSLGRH